MLQPVMSTKAITFRCTSAQYARMNALLAEIPGNRTALLIEALEQFLIFAENEENRALNLFSLVERIDSLHPATTFAEQAG